MRFKRRRRLRTLWTRGNFRITKEINLGWRRIIGIISSFVLRNNQLVRTSQILFPENNQRPRARIKCGLEEIEVHYRTTPPANWSWTGFLEEYPSSGFTGGCKGVEVASESALENHTALKLHARQKGTSKDWHMRWKILYNCRWIPVKDQLFPWDQWLACVKSVLNICSRILWITASGWACNSRQQWALKFQPFTSVLDPIRGQCCFLSSTYFWKIQEVTDQRRYCGAWIEITFCLRFSISKNWTNLPFRWNHLFTRGLYKLKWLYKIAQILKNPLGLSSSHEGPLAVVLSLKVLYLLQPPNISWFWS